jgi:hypothetical protein
MSPTPPISSTPRSSTDPVANPGGDGVTLDVVEARGAQRTGVVWILAISLSLSFVALGAFLLIQAPRMGAVNHPSGQDLNTRDVRKLYTPPTTPTTTNSGGG